MLSRNKNLIAYLININPRKIPKHIFHHDKDHIFERNEQNSQIETMVPRHKNFKRQKYTIILQVEMISFPGVWVEAI
jgi:Ribonuclease G/E